MDMVKETTALLLANCVGLGASSFEIRLQFAYPGHPNKCMERNPWRLELEILISWLPCGHPDISDK